MLSVSLIVHCCMKEAEIEEKDGERERDLERDTKTERERERGGMRAESTKRNDRNHGFLRSTSIVRAHVRSAPSVRSLLQIKRGQR